MKLSCLARPHFTCSNRVVTSLFISLVITGTGSSPASGRFRRHSSSVRAGRSQISTPSCPASAERKSVWAERACSPPRARLFFLICESSTTSVCETGEHLSREAASFEEVRQVRLSGGEGLKLS